METQIIYTIIILALIFIIYPLVYNIFGKLFQKGKIGEHKKIILKRSLNLIVFTIAIISLTLVWGFKLENIWVSITSILALVAIGFFAVWSLLSNIIAGILLFLARPFKIGNHIEIIPEKIKGKVLLIGSMFTILDDEKKGTIHIPNNIMFQKIIRVTK